MLPPDQRKWDAPVAGRTDQAIAKHALNCRAIKCSGSGIPAKFTDCGKRNIKDSRFGWSKNPEFSSFVRILRRSRLVALCAQMSKSIQY